MDTVEDMAPSWSAGRAFPIRTRELMKPRQVRWVAINTMACTFPHQAAAVPNLEDTTSTARLDSAMTQHASHLRGRILDSVSRITSAPPPKRAPRKRLASTPRKKRSAAHAFDSVADDTGIAGAENADNACPAKVAKLRKASKGCQPLSPASPAQLNALPAQDELSGITQTENGRLHYFKLSTPPDQTPQLPDAPRKAGTGAVSNASSSQSKYERMIENETFHDTSHLTTVLTPYSGKRGRDEPLLPASSAPSSSIDGIDYLNDDSLFSDFVDPSSSSSVKTPQGNGGSLSLQSYITPSKMPLPQPSLDPPTPPSLASDSAPSPMSPTTTPLTPSPILNPFIRRPPASEAFPRLQQVPSLKAEHRIVTCFRIAEVLRLQSTLSESAPLAGIPVELYARVSATSRNRTEWLIQFADLFFPDRPPYLTSSYDAGEGSSLFAEDIRNITVPTWTAAGVKDKIHGTQQSGFKLCRAIIQVKQKAHSASSGGTQAAEVKVLSIWETDWEDVERVRGIVDPQYQIQWSEVAVAGPSVRLEDPSIEKEAVGIVQKVNSRGTGWKTSTV